MRGKSSELADDVVERLARAIHERYLRTVEQAATRANDLSSLGPWEQISDEAREQNRAQARDIPEKLALVHRRLAAVGVPLTLSEREIELLARNEHERWCSLKESQGFVYGARRSEVPPKTHPDLLPWDKVGDEARRKDREAVAALPDLLSRAGLCVDATDPLR